MIFSKLFHFKTTSNFNLLQLPEFTIPLEKYVYSSTESISFLGPQIWEQEPSELKEEKSLDTF